MNNTNNIVFTLTNIIGIKQQSQKQHIILIHVFCLKSNEISFKQKVELNRGKSILQISIKGIL